jgi:DNA-binding MarR family transcriptional regulator
MSTPSSKDRRPLLGALLRIAHQVSTERFAAWLEASEFKDVQPAHSAVIQPLWDEPGGLRITALARGARMTKQSMSALVDQLEKGKYVERIDDPDDARATRVRLTAKGQGYAKAVRAFGRDFEAEWAARIGAGRLAALKETLDLLRTEVLEAE